MEEWWITDGFFSNGGKKISGPYEQRYLAIEAWRRLVASASKKYFVDYTKTVDQFGRQLSRDI